MRYPAALPAVALVAGVSAGILLQLPVHPLAPFALWLAAVGAFLARRSGLTTVCVAFGFLACGVSLGDRADDNARAAPIMALFLTHAGAGQHQISGVVSGRLRTDAVQGMDGVTLSLAVDRVEIDRVPYSTSGGVLIGVGGVPDRDQIPQWRAGRLVQFPATLRLPATYLNPGATDAVRQFAWRGTSLVGFVKSSRLVEIVAPGDLLTEVPAAIRLYVRRAVAATVGPWSQRSGAIVTAILIGDRSGLDDDVEQALQEAGTFHVIAISGGNIAILAGLCALVLRVGRVGPRMAAALVIGLLAVYALAVEGGSSVARATLMAAIYFAARARDQEARAANVVALAASVVVCLQPLRVVDAGFALTFGATLGICIGASMATGLTSWPWWARLPAALLGASMCAEIALLPVSAYIFSRVTFAGLVANLAAVPLMAAAQIAGMLAVTLAWWAPEVAVAIGWIAHFSIEGLIGSAGIVEIAPWLARRLPPPSVWLVVGYYTAVMAALMLRQVMPILAALGCGVWIVMAPSTLALFDERRLRVTYLDVGQGDAALVRFPDGRSLVVDAGGLPGGGFDIGSRVVSPALWALGVRRLDYLAVSHGDEDHMGGAPGLFRDFVPFEVWEGVPVPPHRPSQHLRALVASAGSVWRTLQPHDVVRFGTVDLVVHHPPRPDWERQRVRNNDSEVLEVRHGGVSFVFTGDIGREVEETLATSFDAVPIRILKVPHHGSATSSSARFLRALQPDVAVISAGRGNPFGHPVASVLDRYRSSGAAIFRTDQDGAVTVESDGSTVRIRTFTNRRLTLRVR